MIAPAFAPDDIAVHGPERLRIAREELARECGRLCCQLGVDTALRAAWGGILDEDVPEVLAALLEKLGGPPCSEN